MTKLYIDKNVNVFGEDAAAKRLIKSNDSEFYQEGVGIVRVSKERWNVAQEAETNHWMRIGAAATSDRNAEHATNLGEYKTLSGKHFANAIEIGCGPFTNLKLISKVCTIDNCTLVDPLIDRYMKHKWCSYKNGTLNGIPTTRIATPAENMPINCQYDMVVLINVLEHCYDAEKSLKNVVSACKSGGYFIFHDKIYDHKTTEKELTAVYDAAHPLRIDMPLIRKYLDGFDTVFEKLSDLPVPLLKTRRDTIYFIGKKK